MLYETLLQGKIFFCTIYFGILAGILLTAKNFIDNIFRKNKVIVAITDVVLLTVQAILFLICINIFNYGEFRIYEILGYLLGIFLQQISINKIVEKFFSLVYNFLTKFYHWLKSKKLFNKILK